MANGITFRVLRGYALINPCYVSNVFEGLLLDRNLVHNFANAYSMSIKGNEQHFFKINVLKVY